MTRTSLAIRTVFIGDREYEKPYDPACPCCRSPWHLQIDVMLSEGYTPHAIKRLLQGRKPAPPRIEHISAHIDHLAEPHRKLRLQLEEDARERGDGAGLSLVSLADANKALIQKGYAALAAGDLEVTSRDLLRAMALQAQLEKAAAGGQVSADAWQAVFVEMLGIVRTHLSPAQWQAFTNDVYASPTIRQVLAEQQALTAGDPS